MRPNRSQPSSVAAAVGQLPLQWTLDAHGPLWPLLIFDGEWLSWDLAPWGLGTDSPQHSQEQGSHHLSPASSLMPLRFWESRGDSPASDHHQGRARQGYLVQRTKQQDSLKTQQNKAEVRRTWMCGQEGPVEGSQTLREEESAQV